MNEFFTLLYPFSTGFFVSIGLSITIGPQVLFILRQALFGGPLLAPLAVFLSGEIILVTFGIYLGDYAVNTFPVMVRVFSIIGAFLIGGTGVFLLIRAAKAVLHPMPASTHEDVEAFSPDQAQHDIYRSVIIALIVTYGNPQVYLDVIVLIGGTANTFDSPGNILFGFGSIAGSIMLYAFFLKIAPLIRKTAHRARRLRSHLEAFMGGIFLLIAGSILARLI